MNIKLLSRSDPRENKLKCLALGMLALVVLFATSLSAAESSKICLPDGLYMYDSWIEKLSSGSKSVRFEKYFVVKSNVIYSSNEAIKKFGSTKLNKLFTENKRYKILLGGNKIGEIFGVTIDSDGDWNYDETLFTENIKEGPMYGRKGALIGRHGSAVKSIAVPEQFKEVQGKSYKSLSKEEIDKIANLTKTNLFRFVKNRKEIKKTCSEIIGNPQNEVVLILDKVSGVSGDSYIGIYKFDIKTTRKVSWCSYDIIFNVRNNEVHAITSNFDDETLASGVPKICGMLDIDHDGIEELIIEKAFWGYGDDDFPPIMEIYKQKLNGEWVRIIKISEGGK